MHLNDYQETARSFRLPTANYQYARYNLVGEVGELFSLLAKGIRDGAQANYTLNVKKELGDILWHVSAIADDFGLSLDSVAQANLTKLVSRKQRNQLQGSGDDR